MKILLIGAIVVVCAALYAVEPPNITAYDSEIDGVGDDYRIGSDDVYHVDFVASDAVENDENIRLVDRFDVRLVDGIVDGIVDDGKTGNERGSEVALDCEQAEELLYAAPSEDALKKLDGKLELLIFTLKQRDACQWCRVAFEAYNHLEQYPVTNVYLDSVKGRALALDYDANETPTFVLVRRGRNGDGDELARWSGARDVKETCLRVEREFKRANYDTRERGFKPPKKEPRPVPPPKKEPKPNPQPPRNEPRPRPFWSLFFD